MKTSGKTIAERKAFVRNCKEAYESAAIELNLTDSMTAEQKVHNIIMAASSIQGEICSLSDEIKIVNFENIKSIINLQKADWLETVCLYNRKHNSRFGKSSIERNKDRIKERVFSQTFKNKFLEEVIAPEDTLDIDAIKVASKDDLQTSLADTGESTEFAEILKQSAELRNKINSVLYRKYNSYAKAAQYASNFSINYADFKMLVDWEHYKNGGYPSENTPAKLWSVVNKFNLAVRLCQQYGFDQINQLLDEFGLEVVAKKTPSVPVEHDAWWEQHHYDNFSTGEAETTPIREIVSSEDNTIAVASLVEEPTIEVASAASTVEQHVQVPEMEEEEEEVFEDD